MLWQITVVAVMALNATVDPKIAKLTIAAIVTTSRAAFMGIDVRGLTFLKMVEPGRIPSRESANVTRCAESIDAVVAHVQSIQFRMRIAVAPRRPITCTKNSAQLLA